MTQSDQNGSLAFPAFPYPPYSIQMDFMAALYRALEAGGVGLFESPTGTGKTLSLICSSLQWLQDKRQREAEQAAAAMAGSGMGSSSRAAQEGGAVAAAAAEDLPDWMLDFSDRKQQERQQQLQEAQRKRLAKAKLKLLLAAQRRAQDRGKGSSRARQRAGGVGSSSEPSGPDAEFLVEDWVSDDAGGEDAPAADSAAAVAAARSVHKRSPGAACLGSSSSSEGEEDALLLLGEAAEPEVPAKQQIIFASRTHSQLSQFVGELHRTPFGDTMSLVALASRKALCINDAVLRLGSPSLINERCLEMQKPSSSSSSKKKQAAAGAAAQDGGGAGAGAVTVVGRRAARSSSSSGRCPYLAAGSKGAGTMQDMILAQPMDIEELGKLGRRKAVCPYYASRRAIPEADVILAPYSALLVQETRESLGLKLENSIVIIDEAHNLADAINGSHSAELTQGQATAAQRQLSLYLSRFHSQLAPANCRNIQTLIRVAEALAKTAAAAGASSSGVTTAAAAAAAVGQGAGPRGSVGRQLPPGKYSGSGSGGGSSSGEVHTVNNFLFQVGLDNINMFRLVRYVRESKAVFKVAGYWQAQQAKAAAAAASGAAAAAADNAGSGQTGAQELLGPAAGSEGSTGALHALVAFLQALTNEDADGRIVVSCQQLEQPPADVTAAAAAAAGGMTGTAGAAAHAAAADGGSAASRQHLGRPGQTQQRQQQQQQQQQGVLKFVLLNAAAHFARVVSSAHVVILASGTLSPLDSVLQLFPGTPWDRIHHFSCGHVVGPDRLLALALGSGPSGMPLDFRHASRGSAATLDELGRLLANVCQVVPGGVVVFFPSFGYLAQALAHWRTSGALPALEARKRVFCEPRGAGGVEACLAEYAACCCCSPSSTNGAGAAAGAAASSRSGGAAGSACASSVGAMADGGRGAVLGSKCGSKGAVMLCVVGGKLSEGINFGDDLGRCVVMVGLPYPNPSDPELQERIRFADKSASGLAAAAAGTNGSADSAAAAATAAAAAAAAGGPGGGSAGREYYSNLCMKAVNQCIGRVIRHRNDYAAILLVDMRYTQGAGPGGRLSGPLVKLPGWIQQALHVSSGFGDAYGRLVRFCRGRAAEEAAAAEVAVAAGAAAAAAAQAAP